MSVRPQFPHTPLAVAVQRVGLAGDAARTLQDWWRRRGSAPRGTHPGDLLESIPPSPTKHPKFCSLGLPSWHDELLYAYQILKSSGEAASSSEKVDAHISYCAAVGEFTAACRAFAVLCVWETIADPDGTSRPEDEQCKAHPWTPRRILPIDPMWPLIRPRFASDRVYLCGTVLVTLSLGGMAEGKNDDMVSREFAWKLNRHDFKGMGALCDALCAVHCKEPLVPPVAVAVDYLAFRATCVPQVLGHGSEAEFVVGPIAEAAESTGSLSDFPDVVRRAKIACEEAFSLMLNRWESKNPSLRADLNMLAQELRCVGYPIVFESDFPSGWPSAACLRLKRALNPTNVELHFRALAELTPPATRLTSDKGEVCNPIQRLRREALVRINSPPLPLSLRDAFLTATFLSPVPSASPAQLVAASEVVRERFPPEFAAAIANDGVPLDSHGWTQAFHAAGLNMRQIGCVAAVASAAAAAALHREAIARSTKWLLRKSLWDLPQWTGVCRGGHANLVSTANIVAETVVELFNLILGSGPSSSRFWEERVVPETSKRFGIPTSEFGRRKTVPRALFVAMQHHCQVHFDRAATDSLPLMDADCPKPFTMECLGRWTTLRSSLLFPEHGDVAAQWAELQLVLERQADNSIVWPGFHPVVRIACPGRHGLRVNATAWAKKVGERRWDQLSEMRKLELQTARGLGLGPPDVWPILSDIAIASFRQARTETDLAMDQSLLHGAVRSADAAAFFAPSVISTWWAQLSAAESEWLVGNLARCHQRLDRMREAWRLEAADQPALLLRLETLCARQFASEGNWPAAALHTARCVRIAEEAFGTVSPTTIALRARLGHLWGRLGDWRGSATTFERALACAVTTGEAISIGRLSYEVAKALFMGEDVGAATVYAEQAVQLLVPRFWDRRAIIGGHDAKLALACLLLLAQVYEDTLVRTLTGKTNSNGIVGCLSDSARTDMMRKAVRCYASYLRFQIIEPYGDECSSGELTWAAKIVEAIVRLRALCIHGEARNNLFTILVRSFASVGDVLRESGQPHVWNVESSTQARIAAQHILEVQTNVRTKRMQSVYETVARRTSLQELDPMVWWDDMFWKMRAGIDYHAGMNCGVLQATLFLVDVCRCFGVFTPGGPDLRPGPPIPLAPD